MKKQKRKKRKPTHVYEIARDRRAEEILAAIAEERFGPEDALGLMETATGLRERLKTAERITNTG